MNQFSTTQAAGGAVGACALDCSEAWAATQDEVNQIARIQDPIDRNVAITQAYRDLGERMPDNHWVRLAGYVSTQGGCAMQRTQAWDAQTIGRVVVNPEEALDALGDANETIFSSVFPPNLFVANCGFEKFFECVEEGAIQVDEDLVNAMRQMQSGDLERAAETLARHEQIEVVQPIYDRHADTFNDLSWAEALMPGDQTSIPIAYECTRDNLVELEGDISKPLDRVDYYMKLMEEMRRIEGIE